MRTLTFGMNVGGEVYRASVTLPDEDKVLAPITKKPLKVVISKAGGFVKARWGGRRSFVLGETPEQAIKRLKNWN